MATPATLAANLVRLRRTGNARSQFPGDVPASVELAYAVQREAIRLWNEPLAGWKVGGVRPEWRTAFDGSRFVGPIFSSSLKRIAVGGSVNIPIVPGGFGVVEAELVAELRTDIAARPTPYRADEVGAAIGRLYAGAEIAGSAVADIVALGPGAIIADFGVNRALAIGPEIESWRYRPLSSLRASIVWQDEQMSVEGSFGSIEGGVSGALADCATLLGKRGISLRKGDLISTGAICGLRPLSIDRVARLSFDGEISMEIRLVSGAI